MQPAATVMGIPLRPDERVVYFSRPDFRTAKTLMLVMGILFAVVLIGIFFLVSRGKIEQRNPRALILTTHRLLVVQGTGEVLEIPLMDIRDIAAIRFESRMMADRRPRTDPMYWRGGTAIGVRVTRASGGVEEVRCKDRPDAIWGFGRLLAVGLEQRSFASLPTVAYEG